MRPILMIGALLLAACQPISQPVQSPGLPSGPVSAADCAANGGKMRPVGRAQTTQCVIAYADAGKPCSTGSDCLGNCRVETAPFPEAGRPATGRCQADSQPFGCHATVENGHAGPAICVD